MRSYMRNLKPHLRGNWAQTQSRNSGKSRNFMVPWLFCSAWRATPHRSVNALIEHTKPSNSDGSTRWHGDKSSHRTHINHETFLLKRYCWSRFRSQVVTLK